MSQKFSLSSVPGDCEIVSRLLTKNLERAGYRVVRSFDLQRARAVHSISECPHHGAIECDCQMVVLLVYLPNGDPHTITAHGRDGITHLDWHEDFPAEDEAALFAIVNEIFSKVNPLGKNPGSISI